METNWIREQLAIAGKTQIDLADGIGLTPVQVNKILTGYRALKADEADRIRRFFGYFPPEERPSTIAVAGVIGAGDGIELVDAYERGAGMFHIARPDWIPARGVVAAQIKGSSAEPWAMDGDIVFWRRSDLSVQPADLGRPVIAELADGRVMLKRLASSSKPGRWSLISINPMHENLLDVHVVWAARAMTPLASDQMRVIEA